MHKKRCTLNLPQNFGLYSSIWFFSSLFIKASYSNCRLYMPIIANNKDSYSEDAISGQLLTAPYICIRWVQLFIPYNLQDAACCCEEKLITILPLYLPIFFIIVVNSWHTLMLILLCSCMLIRLYCLDPKKYERAKTIWWGLRSTTVHKIQKYIFVYRHRVLILCIYGWIISQPAPPFWVLQDAWSHTQL